MLRRIRFSCVPGSPDWSSHMPAQCRNVGMCLADLAVYEIWQTESTKVMCTVYNINPGNNEDLKKRSQTLREYMIFVGYVNENLAKAKKGEKDYEVAIRDAVNRCIAEE